MLELSFVMVFMKEAQFLRLFDKEAHSPQ